MDRRFANFARFFAARRTGLSLAVFASAVFSIGLLSHLAAADRPRGDRSEQVAASPVPSPELLRLIGPRQVLMEVTAYCPCQKCCGPQAQGLTASGKAVDYNSGRFIAADTRLLPFGTRVSIPGYHDGEPVEVIDRGGAIKGNKLDVFYPTHEAAREWGRRVVMVSVIE